MDKRRSRHTLKNETVHLWRRIVWKKFAWRNQPKKVVLVLPKTWNTTMKLTSASLKQTIKFWEKKQKKIKSWLSWQTSPQLFQRANSCWIQTLELLTDRLKSAKSAIFWARQRGTSRQPTTRPTWAALQSGCRNSILLADILGRFLVLRVSICYFNLF